MVESIKSVYKHRKLCLVQQLCLDCRNWSSRSNRLHVTVSLTTFLALLIALPDLDKVRTVSLSAGVKRVAVCTLIVVMCHITHFGCVLAMAHGTFRVFFAEFCRVIELLAVVAKHRVVVEWPYPDTETIGHQVIWYNPARKAHFDHVGEHVDVFGMLGAFRETECAQYGHILQMLVRESTHAILYQLVQIFHITHIIEVDHSVALYIASWDIHQEIRQSCVSS